MSDLRIAFIGASGTGKTYVTDYIQHKFDLPLNPIGSRSIAKAMGFMNPYDVDKQGLRGPFQRRLFAEKSAWERNNENFVTDRTCFDNLAYACMHGAVDALTSDELNLYVDAMARYTHVIYLPVNRFQKLGVDPVRLKSEAYHKLYDILIRALLDEFKIDDYTLDCPIEARRDEINKIFKITQ